MKLRRLAIYLWDLFPDQFTTIGSVELPHLAFTFLTHLVSFGHFKFQLSIFALFPALTHLSLRQISPSNATALLSSFPTIQVLVRMRYGYGYLDLEERVSLDDARFLAMWIPSEEYVTTDWLAGTRGGEDFWVRAERFIAKKRRGEIKPSSRCWIEKGDGI
ncbi:hypothetical protein FB451DRAFT_1362021 [Mycena latifolia]|nr:hypothetical protein FB451DRAFT_1362021 [Mycena latifolia]